MIAYFLEEVSPRTSIASRYQQQRTFPLDRLKLSKLQKKYWRVSRCDDAAPNFVGITKWFNSAPLSIRDLRGRVVLVDFWTYVCYNCVNTLPYVTKLYETYKDKGLVVVGVHTPEFPFERSASNVQAALKRHGITYPVAQDNDSVTWNGWRAINTGRPNTSSTSAATSSSVMPAKANMMKSSARFGVS